MVGTTERAPAAATKGTFLGQVPDETTVDSPIRTPIPKEKVPAGDAEPRGSCFSVLSLLLVTFFSGFSAVNFGHFIPFVRSGVFIVDGEVGKVKAEFPVARVNATFTDSAFGGTNPTTDDPPHGSEVKAVRVEGEVGSLPAFPPDIAVGRLVGTSLVRLFLLCVYSRGVGGHLRLFSYAGYGSRVLVSS